MVRLREIPRTATFAWSPGAASPLLATGTRAGAVDADFSNDTKLELWDLDLDSANKGIELEPVASIDSDSRFHDIAWVQQNNTRGTIAGALENGSLDLWNAEKLLSGDENALISRTSKHSGAIKTLQFNPFKPDLLATAGAKGELFISDLNNIGNPFRLGNTAARADDFECLDWNKRVPHIMVTGSSGGFVTVWDVKSKKESLTLNNMGRKAVSAVAWDPQKSTRLITAVPLDTDPLILVWDLRNSNAPERILRGHEGGVLSLSWCLQDSDLLLSCGKDNRTICWNSQTGDSYGEFPVVTNWTFQTRWNPHYPDMLATASFDGKIAIQTVQNTKAEAGQATTSQSQVLDGEDFFNKAQTEPQSAAFTLPKAPKWLERPCGASFGFGGKLISFNTTDSSEPTSRKPEIRISDFVLDSGVGTSTESFEKALNEKDLNKICESHIAQTSFEAEKADWKVIETLISDDPRKRLVEYLGFSGMDDEAADGLSKLSLNGDDNKQAATPANGVASARSNRLSSFFDGGGEGDNFLSDLAATKEAKTNSPFHILSGSESESERRITHALMLGLFDEAVEVCLQDGHLSDAFMIATCGGQKCIEKVQKSYFQKKVNGPQYLRLLASVVGKNLWDVVHNADLVNWKEVMATLCTYASAKEFPDLCEALGDRLEEHLGDDETSSSISKDASFCYIAGSKLEKVVAIWITELDQTEKSGLELQSDDSSFSIHARSLQAFIEKVTVFREVTHFEDNGRRADSDWKLALLYDKYTEYADIVASHGQLKVAEKYLDLLPEKYPAAEVARNRVKIATRKVEAQPAKPAAQTSRTGRGASNKVTGYEPFQAPVSQPTAPLIPYAPQAANQASTPYTPSSAGQYAHLGYQQSQLNQQPPRAVPPSTYGVPPLTQSLGPPSRNFNGSASIPPPSKAPSMSNWNDIPDNFSKPPTSRRGTPSVGPPPMNMSFPNQPGVNPPSVGATFGAQRRQSPSLGPPPKGPAPPPRVMSPPTSGPQAYKQPERPSSSAANAYAPQQPTTLPAPGQIQPSIPRGPSPYNAPPSAPPPSNRYTPTAAAQPSTPANQNPPHMGLRQGPPPSNPYAPQANYGQPQPNAPNQRNPYSNPPPQSSPPSRPPIQSQAPPQGPPHGPPQVSRPSTSSSQRSQSASAPPKHPPGDRSHIPENARPIFEVLSADMQRVKARAPPSFKAQVLDTEKRLNILFDHLNNEDLLKPDTVESMVELARALQSRNYELATAIHVDIMTQKTEECGNWMVGVKRLLGMSRATPG